MRASLWYRLQQFVARHAALIGVGIVVVASLVAVGGVRWEANQRADAIRAEGEQRAEDIEAAAADRRAQICAESRNLRALVSELIDTAVAGEPSVNLLDVPSFTGLPASVQTFLRDYVAAVAAGESAPDLAERLREFQRTRLAELPEFCTDP